MVRKFARHFTVLAALRALLSEGSRIEISKAMMPITTKSSTSVNPRPVWRRCNFIIGPLKTTLSPRPQKEVGHWSDVIHQSVLTNEQGNIFLVSWLVFRFCG